MVVGCTCFLAAWWFGTAGSHVEAQRAGSTGNKGGGIKGIGSRAQECGYVGAATEFGQGSRSQGNCKHEPTNQSSRTCRVEGSRSSCSRATCQGYNGEKRASG